MTRTTTYEIMVYFVKKFSKDEMAQYRRFFISGVINTGLTYCIYMILLRWNTYEVAYFIAYVFGIIFAYYVNARYVFKKSLSWKSFFSYPIVYVVQYVLSAVGLFVIIEWFHVSKLLAPCIVIIVVIPVTYMMNKFILK